MKGRGSLGSLFRFFSVKGVYDLRQTVRGNNVSDDSLSFLIVLNISDQEEVSGKGILSVSGWLGKPFKCGGTRLLTAAEECKTVSGAGRRRSRGTGCRGAEGHLLASGPWRKGCCSDSATE